MSGINTRILVLSAASTKIEAFASVSIPNHQAYCARRGYKYRCAEWRDDQSGYQKLDHIMSAMEDRSVEYILYLDADAVFTNSEIAIEDHLLLSGNIVATTDINGMNAGVMLIPNTDFAREFLWTCRYTGRWLFNDAGWHDQTAIRYFSQSPPYEGVLRIVQQRVMNSYRNDLYTDGRPASYCEASQWRKGDFILHLPGLESDARVQAMREALDLQLPASRKTIVLSNMEGLGDLLLLSTLPERLSVCQNTDVWFSSADKPPRNDQVRQMLLANPHLKGFTDHPATDGMIHAREMGSMAVRNRMSPIEVVERVHGLQEPYNQHPRIYSTPAHRPDVAGTVVMDFSAFTQPFDPTNVLHFVDRMIRPRYAGRPVFMIVHPRGVTGSFQYQIPGIPSIRSRGLMDFIGIISSCHAFVSLESGAQALASAIRGNRPFPEVHCLMSTRTFNGRMFTFPNVEQTVVGCGDNFWNPHWP